MAVYQSEWIAQGKPALGGTKSGEYAVASTFNVPAGAAANDVYELCPVEAGTKLIRLSMLAVPFGTTAIGDLVLIPDDGTPNVTLASGINSGANELYGVVVPKEGKLAFVNTSIPTGTGTVPFVVEFTYD